MLTMDEFPIDRILASNSVKQCFLDAKAFPRNNLPLVDSQFFWNDAINQITVFSLNDVMVGATTNVGQLIW